MLSAPAVGPFSLGLRGPSLQGQRAPRPGVWGYYNTYLPPLYAPILGLYDPTLTPLFAPISGKLIGKCLGIWVVLFGNIEMLFR